MARTSGCCDGWVAPNRPTSSGARWLRRVPQAEQAPDSLAVVVPSLIALIALYVAEVSAALILVAVYRQGDRSLAVFLPTPAGRFLIVAALSLVGSSLVLVRQFRRRHERRRLWASAVLNVCSVALALGVAEASVRLLSVNTAGGPSFAGTLLLPKSWERVATNGRAVVDRAETRGSYLVFDTLLGWTVGRSRGGIDYSEAFWMGDAARARLQVPGAAKATYLSSVEGLRSPRAGMALADVPARHRVAALGDSFTFGLEVSYEETFGHQLEGLLGSEFQVLNFGVDGYGVDQAVLRYQRDVRSWKPEIVILGFIADDLRRTMCVYGFLCFPDSQLYFVKPHLVVSADSTAPLNLPLPSPRSMLASPRITDLPFVDDDPGFLRDEWESHASDHSRVIRFVRSRVHPWRPSRQAASDSALVRLNATLLRSFERLARRSGSVPVVAYLPSHDDYLPRAVRPGLVGEVLQSSGVRYLDLTDCVRRVPAPERFLIVHYAPAANAAIARCLLDGISELQRAHGATRR